jgi:hypothetical protein
MFCLTIGLHNLLTFCVENIRGDWSAADQSQFTAYMGQVVNAWSAVTAVTLSNLFNGTLDDNLTTLTSLVANGQFFGGKGVRPPIVAPQQVIDDLQSSVLKAFYAYSIPAIWSVSRAGVWRGRFRD